MQLGMLYRDMKLDLLDKPHNKLTLLSGRILPILLVLLLSLLQATSLMGYPFWKHARCNCLMIGAYWYCIFAFVKKSLSHG